MNILNVQAFFCIARYGSVSAAARALFISQPTLSSRLSQLESDVGGPLLVRRRGGRGVELTPRGREFLPIAEQWLELDRRTRLFSLRDARPSLTLAAPGSLQEYVLPRVLRELLAFPQPPRLTLKTADSNRVYSLTAGREADAGLALRPVQRDGAAAIPLFTAGNVILCPASTLLPDVPLEPRALDPGFEVSVTSWTGEVRRWHDSLWDPEADPFIRVDNNPMARSYMPDPRCWAVCPAYIAVSELERCPDGFAVRTLASPPPRQTCYLVVRRDMVGGLPPLLSRLRELLLAYAEAAPWLEPAE